MQYFLSTKIYGHDFEYLTIQNNLKSKIIFLIKLNENFRLDNIYYIRNVCIYTLIQVFPDSIHW